ncbi:MAG TPA: transglycosylase SLT domain-containing protein [Nocardioidaceae bacterium]|nr:transglycosylase SLT domain-containing protein [Nocardioidaceae bacterium]
MTIALVASLTASVAAHTPAHERRGLSARPATSATAAAGPAAYPTTPVRLVSARSEARWHPAKGHRWHGHPGRWLRPYVVHRGDTATGLAVRFHAWTAELLAANHLKRRSTLYVGDRIVIPVVLAAARKARPHEHHRRHHADHRRHHAKHHKRHAHHWPGPAPSRATVRRMLVRAAHAHDVNPTLALAIGWHESGWRQHVVSPAHAVGVMQVMPATGRWISGYADHPLSLRRLRDNVTAGVLLIHVLETMTSRNRFAIAAYYQGLGSIRAHGLYKSTKAYLHTVRALQHRFARGWTPG